MNAVSAGRRLAFTGASGALVLLIALISEPWAFAESTVPPSVTVRPNVHWGADAKAYVTAPLHAGRRQWLEVGGTAAAVILAYQYDDRMHSHFVPAGTTPIHKPHNPEDALPAVAALGGIWIPARLRNDAAGRREAGAMLEAAVFATTATELLTKVSGRRQPNNGSRNDFHERGDAFPSGHTAFAFAVGTVLAESATGRHRWLQRLLGYGIGVGTAYQRLHHNEHWLSDTVAGAAMGIGTAHFLASRHEGTTLLADASGLAIVPVRRGVAVGYEWPLRR